MGGSHGAPRPRRCAQRLSRASALAQRGVDTTGATDRSIAGRPVLTQAIDQGASTSVTYMLPDFGYVIALTLAQPESSFSPEDNDAIASTVLGC